MPYTQAVRPLGSVASWGAAARAAYLHTGNRVHRFHTGQQAGETKKTRSGLASREFISISSSALALDAQGRSGGDPRERARPAGRKAWASGRLSHRLVAVSPEAAQHQTRPRPASSTFRGQMSEGVVNSPYLNRLRVVALQRPVCPSSPPS